MKHSLELFEQPIPSLRLPRPQDAAQVTELARNAKQAVLGRLLKDLAAFDRYMETSIVAELDDELVGAVLAYTLPYDPETLFIWHVGIADGEKNKGLSSLMLGQLMRRQACAGITRVQTIIPSSDGHAWTLFRRFAKWQHSRLQIQPFYTKELSLSERHDNDNVVTIRLAERRQQAA
jgi:L-2,4-diaminobutyric acid acetyltransferase